MNKQYQKACVRLVNDLVALLSSKPLDALLIISKATVHCKSMRASRPPGAVNASTAPSDLHIHFTMWGPTRTSLPEGRNRRIEAQVPLSIRSRWRKRGEVQG